MTKAVVPHQFFLRGLRSVGLRLECQEGCGMLMPMLPAGLSIMDPIAVPVCSVVIFWGQKR